MIDEKAIQNQLMGWLNGRTQDYDLEYLDPLICDDEIRKASGLHIPPRDPIARDTEALLRDLGQLVQDKSTAPEPSRYLEEDGIGTRVKSDRNLQHEISQAVNRHCLSGNLRHFKSLDEMKGHKQALQGVADKGFKDSLVVLDAMFATRAYLPQEITQTIDLPPQRRNGSVRTLQGVLADIPGFLVTMGDPLVALLMDERAVNRWTPGFDTMMSGGWYPAVRIVGLYRTTTCGHSYIDVIALLARPWPTLDELVGAGLSSDGGPDLPKILDNVRTNYIETILKELTTKSVGSPPTASTTPVKKLDFASYKELLVPLLFFQVFGYLNGVSANTLHSRAYRAYKALLDYGENLTKLSPYLDEQSQELHMTTDVSKLLAEPLHIRQNIRVSVIT